eukprot:12901134-Prorocentrum_lima.AAC.1
MAPCCVDVERQSVSLYVAQFPDMTILLLVFQVLLFPTCFIRCGMRNFLTKAIHLTRWDLP